MSSEVVQKSDKGCQGRIAQGYALRAHFSSRRALLVRIRLLKILVTYMGEHPNRQCKAPALAKVPAHFLDSDGFAGIAILGRAVVHIC